MKFEFVKPKEQIVVTGAVGDRLRLHMLTPPYTSYEFTVESVHNCGTKCRDCNGKIMIGKDIQGMDSGSNRFCSMHNKNWEWIKVN